MRRSLLFLNKLIKGLGVTLVDLTILGLFLCIWSGYGFGARQGLVLRTEDFRVHLESLILRKSLTIVNLLLLVGASNTNIIIRRFINLIVRSLLLLNLLRLICIRGLTLLDLDWKWSYSARPRLMEQRLLELLCSTLIGGQLLSRRYKHLATGVNLLDHWCRCYRFKVLKSEVK